ncbi:MAG TPA: ABC transporter permease [Candidatus Merdiplasma excrementigallinarum]|uniref:ABC transporter permease n=1 Tax=Candidatus Merdiplasma excrementigallinarum TaxID=2840864 RepID=A0A9D1NYN6_9FIRM|nr:ABC transporter permease [Candidatus Merdiplasma excrementigallinarum]
MKTNKQLSNYLQKFSIYIVLVVMFIVCSMLSPYFLRSNNLMNIARQLCVGILIAYGEMILIVSGFLDLSVGSVLALSGVLGVSVYKDTRSMLLAILVALLVGVICNLFNAVFVAQFNVPAFIATLGMQQVARGIALYYTGGANILQLGDFVDIGQGMVGIVPVPVIIVAVITVIVWYLFNHTRYGRNLYAIGGNRKAAEASGINAKQNIYISYIINGLLAGLAGVIFMARNNSGLPNGAVGYEMTGLTAAIVGGTSFTGGVGTVMGTVAGAFIIGFLENIMNLIGVNAYIQSIIEGAIIVVAVAFDIMSKSRKSTKVIMASDDKEKK